jgi:hypothetical protein
MASTWSELGTAQPQIEFLSFLQGRTFQHVVLQLSAVKHFSMM